MSALPRCCSPPKPAPATAITGKAALRPPGLPPAKRWKSSTSPSAQREYLHAADQSAVKGKEGSPRRLGVNGGPSAAARWVVGRARPTLIDSPAEPKSGSSGAKPLHLGIFGNVRANTRRRLTRGARLRYLGQRHTDSGRGGCATSTGTHACRSPLSCRRFEAEAPDLHPQMDRSALLSPTIASRRYFVCVLMRALGRVGPLS